MKTSPKDIKDHPFHYMFKPHILYLKLDCNKFYTRNLTNFTKEAFYKH